MVGSTLIWLVVVSIPLALIVILLIRHRRETQKTARIHNADLVKVVLHLAPQTLDELFALYAQEFGLGAARYARRTYQKWKAGKVRPNNQTFNRLLVHLPKVMSFDLKCEVLRKLREEYCAKDDYQMTIRADQWRETVTPLVNTIIEKSYTAELPVQIESRLKWLAADDMLVARAILAESQAQESRNALALLEKEFDNIEMLVKSAGGRSKVTHAVELPFGTLTLKIKER